MVLLLTAGTLFAQGFEGPAGGPAGGPGGGGHQSGFGMEQLARFRMMFRGLDLTEEQQDEIRSIVDEARERVQTLIETARPQEDRETFMDIFTSPTLTVRDLEDSMGQMDEVRDQVRDIVLQAIVDVHDVLTPEQLEALAEMAEEHAFGPGPGQGMEHDPGMGSHSGMRPDRW